MVSNLLVLKIIVVLAISFAFLFLDIFFIGALPDARSYSLSPVSFVSQEKEFTQINLNFTSGSSRRQSIPRYEIKEFFDLGKTQIIFRNVENAETAFDYAQLANNSLIEELKIHQEKKDLALEIKRKESFLPITLWQDGSFIIIQLKKGDRNYPLISSQRPANNSAAYPAFRTISFEAELKSPLRKANVFFQDEPVELSTFQISQNRYRFSFQKDVLKDKQYWVRAVVSDDQGRITVNTWTFQGQILIEGILGPDRFKYFGWWGQINADGIAVRPSPDTKTEKIDTFSSLHRVKVLKEVIGEDVNGNDVWYQIDGGQYPGAFIFSGYVNPLPQPEAPEEFSIPSEVKQGEPWIDVDLTKNILTLFDYAEPIFATYVSTGREENPTATGTYRIWAKLWQTRMKGGPPLHDYIYDLPGVPTVMYYFGSYAIHGTYWHDKFGIPQSAGCTNLTQGDAAFIFDKVNPKITTEQGAILSSSGKPGTVVNNHY